MAELQAMCFGFQPYPVVEGHSIFRCCERRETELQADITAIESFWNGCGSCYHTRSTGLAKKAEPGLKRVGKLLKVVPSRILSQNFVKNSNKYGSDCHPPCRIQGSQSHLIK